MIDQEMIQLENQIRGCLKTRIVGSRLIALATVDSTNTYARRLINEGSIEEGTVVLAEEQTAGRGRFGRVWLAAKGENLMFSVILMPQVPVEQIGILSLLAAVAVADALHMQTGILPECKWPNDLLLGGKKFCGILSETVLQADKPFVVITGVGINVNQVEFPPGLSQRATSLRLQTGNSYERAPLLCAILSRFEHWYEHLHQSGVAAILTQWRRYATMLGTPVSVTQGETVIAGIALDVADDGGLIIQTPAGMTKVFAGEVTLTPPSSTKMS